MWPSPLPAAGLTLVDVAGAFVICHRVVARSTCARLPLAAGFEQLTPALEAAQAVLAERRSRRRHWPGAADVVRCLHYRLHSSVGAHNAGPAGGRVAALEAIGTAAAPRWRLRDEGGACDTGPDRPLPSLADLSLIDQGPAPGSRSRSAWAIWMPCPRGKPPPHCAGGSPTSSARGGGD
jgi:hypothetical protein